MTETPIRNAATVIVVRDRGGPASVLMGQRGQNAAFMPSKFVFPGGGVDDSDAAVSLAAPLADACADRLRLDLTTPVSPGAIAATAIRELWEETGLRLGKTATGDWELPEDWHGFSQGGLLPDASALTFFCRAITPPGRPRRFDARFFLADAAALSDDPDDFSKASDELSHLQWVRVSEARKFNLPFITEVVIAELAAHLPSLKPPNELAFFDNRGERSRFSRL